MYDSYMLCRSIFKGVGSPFGSNTIRNKKVNYSIYLMNILLNKHLKTTLCASPKPRYCSPGDFSFFIFLCWSYYILKLLGKLSIDLIKKPTRQPWKLNMVLVVRWFNLIHFRYRPFDILGERPEEIHIQLKT